VIGCAFFEAKQMHDLRDRLARLIHLGECNFHHPLGRAGLDFFEVHVSSGLGQGERLGSGDFLSAIGGFRLSDLVRASKYMIKVQSTFERIAGSGGIDGERLTIFCQAANSLGLKG
jgi:hypothetical protein